MQAEILISFIFIGSSSVFAGLVNIANGKPASQSSNLTYPGPREVWLARNAADGKKECQKFDHDHYSGTDNELVPWWQLDLQRIYPVTYIVVYGPNKTKQDQLQGFQVFVSSLENDHQQSIYNNTDYGNGTFTINVSVRSYIVGRYVRIEMPGTYRKPAGRAGSLILCEVEVFSSGENILQLLTSSVKTTMSSVAFNRTSNLAIDGNIGPDPDQCHCCSETENSQLSWWMVDFREYKPVKKVIIYSRNNEDEYRHLDYFQLRLSNNIIHNSTLNQSTSTAMSGKMYQISLSNILTRHITIQRPGVLTICEVIVLQGDCKVGTFGHECSKSCHCGDNKPCDEVTGHCQSDACKTGWRGSACDKKCQADTFGDECREKCYCEMGTCTSSYGICPGKCRRGYHGPHCNQAEIKINNQTNSKFHRQNGSAAVIGGAIGGSAAVLILIATFGAIVFRFRNRKRDENKTKNNDTSNAYITPMESAQYDTIGNSNDNRESLDSGYECVMGV